MMSAPMMSEYEEWSEMSPNDSTGEMILQPGMVIRPQMDEDTAKHLVQELYGLKVKQISEMNSYDDKNYKVLVEEESIANAYITDLWSHGYILKVLNSMESKKEHIDAEHECQHALHDSGISCPRPVLDVQGRYKSIQRIYHNPNKQWQETCEDAAGPYGEHVVRLMTFIPGRILLEVPFKPQLMYKAGKYIGSIDNALLQKKFKHPALSCYQSIWSLLAVPRLTEFLPAVKSERWRQLASNIIETFQIKVLSKLEHLQKGAIHGDFNDQNIIVTKTLETAKLSEKEHDYDISGVIDFGDMTESYYVFDIAITIMYLMVESKVIDPLLAGGHALAGYLTQMELSDVEFSVLQTCVAARFCQSLVMGAYSSQQDPDNEYLLSTANSWPLLQQLWNTPEEQLYSSWRYIINEYHSQLN